MRLTFEVDGGFVAVPSRAHPVLIDTDQLTTAEAARWRKLVADAEPWERARAPLARAGGDRRSYRLMLDDGDRHVALRLQDPLPAELRPLVEALRAHRAG